MKANHAALDCGQLAERMASGYFAHVAAIGVATDPRAFALVPEVEPGQVVPVGRVFRKDGTEHTFHYIHYLREARTNPSIMRDLEQVWLAGSLLAVGDAAAAHGYFDRAPELELLRHLRNAVAHGNHFRIDKPAGLRTFPAHNRLALVKGDAKAEFEITPSLHGQRALFDFMGPGDVLDLLMSLGLYLIRMDNGDPPPP